MKSKEQLGGLEQGSWQLQNNIFYLVAQNGVFKMQHSFLNLRYYEYSSLYVYGVSKHECIFNAD